MTDSSRFSALRFFFWFGVIVANCECFLSWLRRLFLYLLFFLNNLCWLSFFNHIFLINLFHKFELFLFLFLALKHLDSDARLCEIQYFVFPGFFLHYFLILSFLNLFFNYLRLILDCLIYGDHNS